MGLGKNILDAASLFDKELFNQRVQIDQALAAQRTNELLSEQINNQKLLTLSEEEQKAYVIMKATSNLPLNALELSILHRLTPAKGEAEELKKKMLESPLVIKRVKAKQKELLEKTGSKVSFDDIIEVYSEDMDLDRIMAAEETANRIETTRKQMIKDGDTELSDSKLKEKLYGKSTVSQLEKEALVELRQRLKKEEEEDKMAFLQAKAEAEEEEELAAIQKQFEDEEEAKVNAEIAEQEQKQQNLKKQRMQKRTERQSAETHSWFRVIKNIFFAIFIMLFVILLVFLFVVPTA